MYKCVIYTPKTVVPKTINFSMSLDVRSIPVNIREQDKLPCYKYSSCRVKVYAWGNVCVCCRQEVTRGNIRRDGSNGEASKSQTETTEHVFLSATGDGFLGKTIYCLFECCIMAWLLVLSLTWKPTLLNF